MLKDIEMKTIAEMTEMMVKVLRENGIKPRDRKRALEYFKEKEIKAAEAAKLEAEEKAMANTHLLEEIRDLLKENLQK